MAFENLFIRTKKFIGSIQLDAVISESHSNSVRVTENPIELGADISDHAIIEPKVINILATVSDTPLGFAALAQIVDSISGLFGSSTSGNQTRSISAYNAIVLLQESRIPIDIQTKLRLYTSMIITNITTDQDKDSSRMVNMRITAKEVRITETLITQLTPEQLQAGVTREQASSTVNRGRVAPVTPDESVNKSILKSVLDWVSE